MTMFMKARMSLRGYDRGLLSLICSSAKGLWESLP
jgi:hypothetical protein